MTIDQQIEILTAIKDGKKIEVQDKSDGTWLEHSGEVNFYFNYRVSAEPRRWLIYTYQGKTFAAPYSSYLLAGTTLICTATEDPLPTSDELSVFVEKVNAELDEKQTAAKPKSKRNLSEELIESA